MYCSYNKLNPSIFVVNIYISHIFEQTTELLSAYSYKFPKTSPDKWLKYGVKPNLSDMTTSWWPGVRND